MNLFHLSKTNRAALFFAMTLLPTGLVYAQSKRDTVQKEKQIEEVVMIGYGKQKKADLTSAISTLNPKEVLKAPGGVASALQGTVAGVNVSGGKIRIRGTASITGSTDPLWVVDGIIGGVIPNDDEIESIQVLKDAASSAIYGVRGSNGVILVTTKKGKKGAMQMNFNTYYGISELSKKIDMMNAYDYSLYVNELYYNSSSPADIANGTWNKIVPTNAAKPSQPLANTNWFDKYFTKTAFKKYNFSVNGGGDWGDYRFGVSHEDSDNSLDTYKFNTNNIFGNVQATKGKFTFGGRINLSFNNTDQKTGASLMNTLMLPSNLPVYNPDGSYYITGINGLDGNDLSNQVWFLKNQQARNRSTSTLANAYVEYKILDWLKFKSSYTYQNDSYVNEERIPQYDLGASRQNYNYQTRTRGGGNHQIWENLLSYDKSFGKHNFSGTVGTISETFFTSSTTNTGQSQEINYFAPEILYPNNQTIRGDKYESAFYSYLGRLMYNYDSKYLFTANFRADQTSKFAPGKRWGYFPSFSIGWNVTRESFMQSTSNWLNNWKIRATLGWIGSAGAVGNYDYQSVVQINNRYYTFGSGQTSPNAAASNVPAPLPESIANKELTWETTKDMGLGTDIDLFNNKLSINIDYYNRQVSNMIVGIQPPGSAGTPNIINMNVGDMTNKGLEVAATYRPQIGNVKFSISPNFSTYSNMVTSLGTAKALAGGNINTGANVTKTVVGKPVAQFWGYQTNGIFKTDAEAKASGQQGASAGDLRYVDRNGDGKITEEDKTYLGSPLPKWSAGINITLEYKGFDFSILGQGDFGNKIYNNWKSQLMGGYAAKNQLQDMNNRFRATDITFTTYGGETVFLPANTNTNIPRAILNDPNNNHINASDYFIEDGSYFRINRITLGYTLKKDLTEKLFVQNLRFYAGVRNPFTFTNYSMFDPQVPNSGSTLDRGVDGTVYYSTNTYWSPREYFWGLQLTF